VKLRCSLGPATQKHFPQGAFVLILKAEHIFVLILKAEHIYSILVSRWYFVQAAEAKTRPSPIAPIPSLRSLPA
jgi:hypothetical protein